MNQEVNVSLPVDLKRKLDSIAGELGITTSEVITTSILTQLPKFEKHEKIIIQNIIKKKQK